MFFVLVVFICMLLCCLFGVIYLVINNNRILIWIIKIQLAKLIKYWKISTVRMSANLWLSNFRHTLVSILQSIVLLNFCDGFIFTFFRWCDMRETYPTAKIHDSTVTLGIKYLTDFYLDDISFTLCFNHFSKLILDHTATQTASKLFLF